MFEFKGSKLYNMASEKSRDLLELWLISQKDNDLIFVFKLSETRKCVRIVMDMDKVYSGKTMNR